MHETTLLRRIERMESEFQVKLAALVFQSHSEIMVKMIQLQKHFILSIIPLILL